ncbi:MAG: hypothetical protein ACI9MR_004240 [Myxococcota bacterium]|jgi:hypothetical protein
MRRFISLLLCVLLFGASTTACDSVGPKGAYYGLATAAEMGDRDGFLRGFTEKSEKLVQAQISISEAYGRAYGLQNDDPIKQLVFSNVDAVEINDDKAILSVSRGAKKRKILMVNDEARGWVIDVAKLADFWEEERKKR